MKKILFIDDESNILRAINRAFRNLEFECYYANGIIEAIEIYLKVDQLDMIITDVKMPYFDGLRVLKLFKEASPETIRVAITGYASAASITEAISKNLAKQYFYKPWNNDELIDGIRKMFILEDKLKSSKIYDIVQQFDSIKTLPKLYNELNLCIQRDKSIEEITRIIERDPAIASNVLRIANSAFYAAKTGSIQQAIMYIGLNNLKQIVLSYEISQMKEHMFSKCEFIWTHSNRTNLIFQDLYAKYFKAKVPAIISAAGIVHDIGKIIMLQIFGDRYYNETVKEGLEDDQLIDVEKSLFGIDHSTLGGYFLNWWAFPLDIIEMTLYHHTPKDPDISNKKLVALMCIASKIEMQSFQSDSIHYMDARDILNIDDSFLMDIHIKYNEVDLS
ncbi:MAG TPA: response regulator [Fusibacter sp.]|nr:response regulator [Fusibacter sp.]